MNVPDTGESSALLSADRQTMTEVRALMIEQFARFQRYRGLTQSTIRRRTSTLRLLERFVAPIHIGCATTDQLEQFLASKRAVRTRSAYRSDIRMFYEWAHRHGLADSNPAEHLDHIRVPKGLPRPIDERLVPPMLWFGSLKVRRMVALKSYAGLRTFEVAALDASDVWLHTDPAVVVVRNGKGGKDRSVPLHPALVELFAGLPGVGPVFPGRGCRPMRPGSVARAIRSHLARAQVIGSPHQLRHTFCTALARESGGDVVLTAELAGHESYATTMNYIRLTRTGYEDVIGRMYGGAA